MEEEKNVKKDEESVSQEDYLRLKKSNDKKNAIIIILVFIMILVLALVLLLYFKLKDKQPEKVDCPVCKTCEICNCNEEKEVENIVEETNNDAPTGKINMKKITLNKNNQNVVIGGKTLKMRVVNKELYVNDVKVYKYNSNGGSVYDIFISEKLKYGIIAQEYESMCGNEPDFEGAISLDGNFAKIEYKSKDSAACLDEVYYENNMYYAHYIGDFDNYNMNIVIK